MKKIAIIGLSLLLSACASETYISDVSTESHREDYNTEPVAKPIMTSENDVIEQNVEPMVLKEPSIAVEPAILKEPIIVNADAEPEEKRVIKLTPKTEKKPVKVVTTKPEEQEEIVEVAEPDKKLKAAQKFGYTIQVVAVGSQAKVDQFMKKLPKSDQPIWEHYKEINGTKWFSVLYGDYTTFTEAKHALAALPEPLQKLKPFVKNINVIKTSAYPTLNKLN